MLHAYDLFYRNITAEAWEFFAIDFLSSLGFEIVEYPSRGPDGGKDGLVAINGKRYVVSCKHYYGSGSSVGVSDEQSISDRVVQHNAHGFIGFYSTVISSSLSNRFNGLTNQNIECIVFDQYKISDFLPQLSSQILQKYGLPNNIKFVMNVEHYNYLPLKCLDCDTDILTDQMIPRSMAMVMLNNSNELEYLYGCKRCIGNYIDKGWLELSQGLHQEEFNGWVKYVNDLISIYPVSNNFYQNKSTFESKVPQRMFPSNWGKWLNI